MKIAFVSDAAFPWHVGGVEQTERAEAEALAREHEVHFFSFRWKGMRKEFTDKGIHYHCAHYLTDNEFYRHGRRSIREAVYFSFVAWRIFSDKFDIVQVDAFPYLHLPAVKLYCAMSGAKLIVDVAETWNRKRWIEYLGPLFGEIMHRYTNWTLSGADIYIANPGSAFDGLVSLGIDRKRIHLFTPVLNDSELSEVRSPQRRGLVAYIGRLIKEKRFERWLEVVKDAHDRNPDVRGVIVGDGPEKRAILHTIKALGLERVVSLHGYYRNRKDAHRVLKGASLYLNMSEREGLSATTLESLALGTPVVLPDYSPIPNTVKSMCVVDSERFLASIVAKIAKSKKKGSFIKNRKSLESFKTSNILPFYKALFKKFE